MSIQEIPNLGIYLNQINPFLFKQLKQECLDGIADIKLNYENRTADLLELYQHDLEKDKYFLEPEKSKNFLTTEVLNICWKCVDTYSNYYTNQMSLFNDASRFKLYIERFWINYQFPGEFIPLHRHSGLFSFVIWINIPTPSNNFKEYDLMKGNQGKFQFVFTNLVGEVTTHDMAQTKKYEGKICVFPANLYHQVYPHYEDDVRISVSGNIRVTT